MLAYVLVSLKKNVETELYTELIKYKEVKDAHVLFGEWDMLIKIQAHTTEDIGTFVIEKIRANENVNLTSTLIVAK